MHAWALRLSREEVEAVLHVHDIRETRVFQEGLEEGMEKGLTTAIARMAASGMSADAIAAILKLDSDTVRRNIASGPA